jgi:hypothetical protein
MKHVLCSCCLAILTCACTVNGKTYGLGGGHAGASTVAGSTSPGDSATTDDDDGDKYRGATKYGYGPADPWLGVDGDHPRANDNAESWVLRGDPYDCNAAHDHCIDPLVWFTARGADLRRGLPQVVGMGQFGNDPHVVYGPVNSTTGPRYDDDFTAYRTVPATKANLAAGTLVVVLSRSAGKLSSATHAYESSWWVGEVEEINAEGGYFTLKHRDDVFELWGARAVVLTWKPGGKVTIVGGKKRDQLAVRASDVYLP